MVPEWDEMRTQSIPTGGKHREESVNGVQDIAGKVKDTMVSGSSRSLEENDRLRECAVKPKKLEDLVVGRERDTVKVVDAQGHCRQYHVPRDANLEIRWPQWEDGMIPEVTRGVYASPEMVERLARKSSWQPKHTDDCDSEAEMPVGPGDLGSRARVKVGESQGEDPERGQSQKPDEAEAVPSVLPEHLASMLPSTGEGENGCDNAQQKIAEE
jgi:hypothetical protein